MAVFKNPQPHNVFCKAQLIPSEQYKSNYDLIFRKQEYGERAQASASGEATLTDSAGKDCECGINA